MLWYITTWQPFRRGWQKHWPFLSHTPSPELIEIATRGSGQTLINASKSEKRWQTLRSSSFLRYLYRFDSRESSPLLCSFSACEWNWNDHELNCGAQLRGVSRNVFEEMKCYNYERFFCSLDMSTRAHKACNYAKVMAHVVCLAGVIIESTLSLYLGQLVLRAHLEKGTHLPRLLAKLYLCLLKNFSYFYDWLDGYGIKLK